LKPKLIRLPAMDLAGFVCHTTTRFGESFFAIPKFWQDYLHDGRMERLLGEEFAANRVQYGVNFPEDPLTGNFDYFIGVPVRNGARIPKTYKVRRLPSALYAAFSSDPAEEWNFSAAVYNTWAYVFGAWLPASGMAIDGKGLQFERYDERATRISAKICDIYVPVIPFPAAPRVRVSQSSPNTIAVNV
jgi:AraC family transcriptional regulator